MPTRVLVVGATENRDAVTSAMSHWSIDPVCCSGVQEARSLLPNARPSLIFCDEMLADGTYRDLLHELGKPAKTHLVVISLTPDLHYNEAIGLGAFDMIASPCRRTDVQWIAIRAMQEGARRSGNKRRLKPENDGEPGSNPEPSAGNSEEKAPQEGR
jgi:DNA-binding NtrC family response regulator